MLNLFLRLIEPDRMWKSKIKQICLEAFPYMQFLGCSVCQGFKLNPGKHSKIIFWVRFFKLALVLVKNSWSLKTNQQNQVKLVQILFTTIGLC